MTRSKKARPEASLGTGVVRECALAIAERVHSAGGRALVVGGAVRDALAGRSSGEPEDLDLEIFGLAPDRIHSLLDPEFGLSPVGRAFGIFKVRNMPIDIGYPRDASLPGAAWARELGPEQAALRRDFTINAIAFDPRSGAVIDPTGGLSDLTARVLRHTSEAFADDPLRIYRAMQLCARLEFSVAPETVALCRRLHPADLARERVFDEWRKLIELGAKPSLGLAFLRECGWHAHTPELAALIGCEQDPQWHPEGDVWVHTLHCMDAFARERLGDSREDLVVGLAVLCHDLGKPGTTRREGAQITSKAHEKPGEDLTRTLLWRWTHERELIDEVAALVGAHLAPVALHRAGAGDAAVRRLARRVGRIDRLVRVAAADQRGRPPIEVPVFEAGEWLLERARALEVEAAAPAPIVQGRHLLELGLAAGPRFRPILDACYEAQLEGRVRDLASGLDVAREFIARGATPAEG